MRDISRELKIIERAEEILNDKQALDFVRNQKIALYKGKEIKVVEAFTSEILRARVILAAIQLNKTHLVEDGFAKKVMAALPTDNLKKTFEHGVLSANKTTQEIALGAALDQITQRIRALISIIEGATLFNASLLKKAF